MCLKRLGCVFVCVIAMLVLVPLAKADIFYDYLGIPFPDDTSLRIRFTMELLAPLTPGADFSFDSLFGPPPSSSNLVYWAITDGVHSFDKDTTDLGLFLSLTGDNNDPSLPLSWNILAECSSCGPLGTLLIQASTFDPNTGGSDDTFFFDSLGTPHLFEVDTDQAIHGTWTVPEPGSLLLLGAGLLGLALVAFKIR